MAQVAGNFNAGCLSVENLAGTCAENFKAFLTMLNWTGLCGLLMPLIGAMSGLGSARDMKAGILTIILFTFAFIYLTHQDLGVICV
jgi:hypothetical protein